MADVSDKVLNHPKIQNNYKQFVAELTRITRQYGIALQVCGGVYLAEDPAQFANVTYRADMSSGDLLPQSPDWGD